MEQLPTLKVELKNRAFTRTIKPAGIKPTVIRYSHGVDGGPQQALIRGEANPMGLLDLFLTLRGSIQITDGAADPVWWGYFHALTIYDGKMRYSFTLDEMSNSINLLFLLQSINQSNSSVGQSTSTGFSSDATSVADYGTKQLRLRGKNGSLAAAQAQRTGELAVRKIPQITIDILDSEVDEPYCELDCRGWSQTLEWQFFTNTSGNAAGFEQNNVTTSEVGQSLGRAHPAQTTIRFTSNKIIENTAARWAIGVGSYVYFTGTTAGTNDKAWLLTTQIAAGANYYVTPTTVATQAVGASIVTHDVGTKIYQTFTLSSANPFYAVGIDIRCAKDGAPTDNITVKLYSDSGSLTPGVLLATGTILNSEVPSYKGYKTATLNTQPLLSFGTVYGIELSRSGSEGLDCFSIGVDTAVSYSASGSLRLWTGATLNTWVARPVNASLIFKVAGQVETTTQMQSVITACGQFITATDIDTASGQIVTPYADGTQSGLTIMRNLLAFGSSNSKRMLWKITPDRRAFIYEEPASGSATDLMVDRRGVITAKAGTFLAAHKCPYGQNVEVSSLVLAQLPSTKVFLDEVEYTVADNSLRVVKAKNFRSVFDITGIKT